MLTGANRPARCIHPEPPDPVAINPRPSLDCGEGPASGRSRYRVKTLFEQTIEFVDLGPT